MSNPTLKKILVLGSSGFLGNFFINRHKHDFLLIPTHNHNKIHTNSIFVDITSINSLEKIFQSSQPDLVLNFCSVYKNPEFCEQNKNLVMAVNGDSLKTISKLCNNFSSSLIHFSSDYVFDGINGNYLEDHPVNPINFFGKSKVVGEKHVEEFANDYCIIRTGMVYGTSPIKQTLPDWILNKIEKQQKLELISDQFMTPTYIENLMDMLIEVIKKNIGGKIHLSGPQKFSRYTFCLELLKIMGISYDITSVSQKSFEKTDRPTNSSLNTSKASLLLDKKPESFKKSIEKYLNTRL